MTRLRVVTDRMGNDYPICGLTHLCYNGFDRVPDPHESCTKEKTMHPAQKRRRWFFASCFLLPKIGGVEVLQTFRQTDPKPVVVRARAPAELAEALKNLATKQDVELSRVVRAALFAGVKIMLAELAATDQAVTP